MFTWLFQTDKSAVGLLLRLTLAVVIFPHGAQKVLGWFGGEGFTPTLQLFTGAGIPLALALLAMGRRVSRPAGPRGRTAHAGGRLWDRLRDARRDSDGALVAG